jgi:cell fate (sporulation/competence/biofilm development) regulator YlbF (YheA/YmcA/DUF963 family)
LKPFTLSLCVAPQRQLSIAASMMLRELETFFAMMQNEQAIAAQEKASRAIT